MVIGTSQAKSARSRHLRGHHSPLLRGCSLRIPEHNIGVEVSHINTPQFAIIVVECEHEYYIYKKPTLRCLRAGERNGRIIECRIWYEVEGGLRNQAFVSTKHMSVSQAGSRGGAKNIYVMSQERTQKTLGKRWIMGNEHGLEVDGLGQSRWRKSCLNEVNTVCTALIRHVSHKKHRNTWSRVSLISIFQSPPPPSHSRDRSGQCRDACLPDG
jgi:hypothetical protein